MSLLGVAIASMILAVVVWVLWKTGFALDLEHGARMIERDGALPDLAGVEPKGNRAFDPVCGMEVERRGGVERRYGGRTYLFCSANCRRRFDSEPKRFIAQSLDLNDRAGSH